MDKKYLKSVLLFAAFQLITISVSAQKQFNVLDWKTDASLNTFLVQQMHGQYDARRTEFTQALHTKAQTETYIQSVRQKFKTVLGKLPAKADLNVQISGSIQQSAYRIEKILYQSFQNHHVSANLYIPEGKGPFPAVLLFCGHEDASKATPSYQQTAILFAKNGFVVFVIDPISQSERVQLTDANGKSLTRGSTTEHTLLNLSANLLGTSVPAYELFDNVRGLDYLETRPEVDATKIGCIGNSGGAMQTIYFAAFDDRVKIIAPCSYLASRERTLETTGPADGCAQIPGEGRAQLEMSDYLIAAAPKPMLILAGRYDFIDYTGTLQSYADLKQVYQSLSAPEKLKLFTFDDGHGISKPKREVAVQWFRQWFYNDAKPIIETDLSTLSDQELFASTSGKMNTAFADEVNIAQKNLQLFDELAPQRAAFAKQNTAERKAKIQQLLGIDPNNHRLTSEVVGTVNAKEIPFQKIILRKQQEIPMPILLYQPQQKAKKVVILLSDEGKNKLADSTALLQSYIQQGYAIMLADVRGTGETTDKPELNDPKYFSKDYRNAMFALHIGKPLLGQKTTDILTLIDFIQANTQTKDLPVEILAKGNVGLSALHAAFLNSQIQHLNLQQSISSYREVLASPLVKDRYATVISGVLAYYDLPDLVRWIGEEKLK